MHCRTAVPIRALVALCVLGAACGAPAPERARGLVVHTRLADTMPRDAGTWLTWGDHAAVGGELRPVVSAGRRVRTLGTWEETGAAPFAAVGFPADVELTPSLFVTITRPTPEGRSVVTGPTLVRRDDPSALVRPAAAGAGAAGKPLVADVTLAPEVAMRDLASGPVTIPAGAIFQVAFAVQEPAWAPEAPAVEFTVTADGDGETVLHRATLDPARRPGDRRWFDVRMPLDRLAGRTVRFRFAARPMPGDGASITLPVWSEPVILAPSPRDPPVGVVLVSLDTLRARSTSGGGAARATTPRLDRDVGLQGVTFENASTTAPHTLPAHVSLFTGTYLRTHGVRSPFAVMTPERPTLAETLRDAGWATAAFTENGFVLPDVGLRRGFGRFRENKSANLHRPEGFAATIFGDGLEWLAAHRDQGFFLFLHTYQVHFPYVPPAPYDEAFESPGTLRTLPALNLLRYEQEARYLDEELGVFLDGLQALGLRERTLVVVTSDHGEEFGEHGQQAHGFQLYDEVARVPLVMRLPGALPAGRRVPEAVSLVDVAPTILDLLGLPALPGADGRSLVPLLIDGTGPFTRDGVFAETISNFFAGPIDVVALRSAGLSCVFQLGRGGSECFDPAVDPWEESPLDLEDGDPRLVRAREQLAAFLGSGAAAPGGTPAVGVNDEERLEKLRALGYVEE